MNRKLILERPVDSLPLSPASGDFNYGRNMQILSELMGAVRDGSLKFPVYTIDPAFEGRASGSVWADFYPRDDRCTMTT